MKYHYMVDFENLQKLPPDFEQGDLTIFIGINQKVPAGILLKVQAMGERAKFKIVREGGKDSLDHYLAWYLGQRMKEQPDIEFRIVSRDTDYDRLIRQMKVDDGEGVTNIKRVEI